MRVICCSSVVLLSLALSQVLAAPGMIEKKSLAEETKSGLKIKESSDDKERAKKSAAFCVEIRPGSGVYQKSRNCREKKSNDEVNAQQSAMQNDDGAAPQLAANSQASEPSQQPGQTMNVPPGQPEIDQGIPCGGLTKIPSMPGTPYSPEQANADNLALIPMDLAAPAQAPNIVPSISVPVDVPSQPDREPAAVVDPGMFPGTRQYPDVPAISALLEDRLRKCIRDAVQDIYQPTVPVQVDPDVLGPAAALSLADAPNDLVYSRRSNYMQQSIPRPLSAMVRSAGANVNTRIAPGGIVQELQKPYYTVQARNSAIPAMARNVYRQVPMQTPRKAIVTVEQPFRFSPQYPLTDELYHGPGVIERVRFLRSSKDGEGNTVEGKEEESKEKEVSS